MLSNSLFFVSDEQKLKLQPLVFMKAIRQLRIGIDSVEEKWTQYLEQGLSTKEKDYFERNFKINEAIIPDSKLVNYIKSLTNEQSLVKGEKLLISGGSQKIEYPHEVIFIERPWDIFTYNHQVLEADFERITEGRKSEKLHSSNILIGDESNLFIEEGAQVYASSINCLSGKVYIGKNAEIMENCSIRGSFALCENAVLKMGAKIYGSTTIGPNSKVGGELSNVLIQANSNKAHDGFVGNSVIGEWCNLGADTNSSNLKNNYSKVKAYSYFENDMVDTNLQFCGLIMGDHCKTGINTMLNTGTVCGLSANVFGADFPPKFIPSFSWGGAAVSEIFLLDKAIALAEKVKHRRNQPFTQEEKDLFTYIFNKTQAQ